MANKLNLLFIILLFSLTTMAANDGANLVAVGQGISSPSSTSTVNYTSGFTVENPVGILYQNNFRLTLQYDQNDSGNSKNYGAEFGYGNKDLGLAVGYRKPDCSGCDGRFAANIAGMIGSVGLGVKFAEHLYGVGLLFGAMETHRLGIVVDVNDTAGVGNKVTTYGLGYSYVGDNITFAIDASKVNYENTAGSPPDITIVSPGVTVRTDKIQLSITDRIALNHTNKTQDDTVWFGLGVGGDSWHFVGYADYVNDVALAASFYF